METIWIIILCMVYYVSGISGFIYWWTTDYDLDLIKFLFSFYLGLAGPFTWLAGWCIHGKPISKTIIIKKKKVK